MEPRERVLAALDHREADRVPRDLAGTRYSSIHAEAYRRLRPALGLPEAEIRIVDTTQGLAHVHDDVLARFGADVALVSAGSPTTYRREVTDDGEYERFLDEFGVLRARPHGGLYYESTTSPLAGDISRADIDAYPWPDPQDRGPFRGHDGAGGTHPRRREACRLRGLVVRRRDRDALPHARLRARLHGHGPRSGARASADGDASPS